MLLGLIEFGSLPGLMSISTNTIGGGRSTSVVIENENPTGSMPKRLEMGIQIPPKNAAASEPIKTSSSATPQFPITPLNSIQ